MNANESRLKWRAHRVNAVPGDRIRVLTIAVRRAMLLGKRIYGFDSIGSTYEIRIARSDVWRKSDGARTRVKGTIHCPATTTHVCVEGDELWTVLPGSVSVAAWKSTESARRKRERVAPALARSAAGR